MSRNIIEMDRTINFESPTKFTLNFFSLMNNVNSKTFKAIWINKSCFSVLLISLCLKMILSNLIANLYFIVQRKFQNGLHNARTTLLSPRLYGSRIPSRPIPAGKDKQHLDPWLGKDQKLWGDEPSAVCANFLQV